MRSGMTVLGAEPKSADFKRSFRFRSNKTEALKSLDPDPGPLASIAGFLQSRDPEIVGDPDGRRVAYSSVTIDDCCAFSYRFSAIFSLIIVVQAGSFIV